MSLLFINPVAGMAGDMLCAALMDLLPQKQVMLSVMQETAGTLGGAEISFRNEVRGETAGLLLGFVYRQNAHSRDSGFLLGALQRVCLDHKITGDYREFAERAFTILKNAEQSAHGRILGQARGAHHDHTVHLHEAQDIIVDIAGSSWALQELAVDLHRVCCFAPVAVGGGKINFSHGTFPVPAPATAEIISGYNIPVVPGPVNMELFTPTGASLLAALAPVFMDRPEKPSLFPYPVQSGVGFGSKRFPSEGRPENALYVYLRNDYYG